VGEDPLPTLGGRFRVRRRVLQENAPESAERVGDRFNKGPGVLRNCIAYGGPAFSIGLFALICVDLALRGERVLAQSSAIHGAPTSLVAIRIPRWALNRESFRVFGAETRRR
jgi:hypothetical protein